jgi:multidrug efflux system membrane fusion protein
MDERIDRTETETPSISRPAPRRSRWRWLLLVLLVAAAGAGVLVWHHAHQAPQPAAKAAGRGAGGGVPPQPVGAATVDTGDIRVILNELGAVTPLATVTVMTQINGQLMSVGFKEGQLVKKGDFLAQIDDRPYQVSLEKDLGQLAHDQGLLDQAKADLKRFVTLGRQDSIAQQQLDDQHYLVEQYTGTVKADQGVVDNDKLNIAYCHIVAPVTGRVGLRQVDVGNYVQTSSTSGLVVLTQLDPISVIFTVTEDNIPEIMQRLDAGATLPVEAYDRSNTTHLASGTVGAVDNEVDTATGTVKIRAMFDNPKDNLFPSQFVNARLLVDTLHNVVRVPVAAVQQGAPGAFVYVINANNTVSVKTVKLGPTDGPLEQVVSGLTAGERVVTDGTDRLRDGAKVIVPTTPGSATTGSATTGSAAKGSATTGSAANGSAAGQATAPAGAAPASATPASGAAPAGAQHRREPQAQPQTQ